DDAHDGRAPMTPTGLAVPLRGRSDMANIIDTTRIGRCIVFSREHLKQARAAGDEIRAMQWHAVMDEYIDAWPRSAGSSIPPPAPRSAASVPAIAGGPAGSGPVKSISCPSTICSHIASRNA